MAAYQLHYASDKMVNAWKEMMKERAMKRKQRELRKRAEMLVKLKRELQQAHKLSMGPEGKSLCWWPLVEEWEQVKREAKMKKEGQSIPLKVKKEEPSYL